MKRLLFGPVFVILGVCLLLILAEGVGSLFLVARRLKLEPNREELITQYSADLGWAGVPGRQIEDAYGPGRGATINRRGFRGPADIDDDIPPGKLRVLCSGDSFTFGAGVGDDGPWPFQLAEVEPLFETVNMAQNGYGVDQMYLRFLREGVSLERDVHLFSFIDHDFSRALMPEFSGYPKPLLELRDGKIITANTPVPPLSNLRRYWNWNRGTILNELRMVRGLRFLAPDPPIDNSTVDIQKNQELIDLFAAIIRTLNQIEQQRGGVFVMVNLPQVWQQDGGETNEEWRNILYDLSRQEQVLYFDLIEELRQLPAELVPPLYLNPQVSLVPGTAFHYTDAGGEFVAKALRQRLLGLPGIQRKLQTAQAAKP